MLPDEHRPRHVDVGGFLPVEQVVDPVREVLVASDDADVELEARLLLELAGVPLDARDVGVGVGAEEPDGGHRSNVSPS